MGKDELVVGAEDFLHHFNEQQRARIVDKVINTVSLFFRAENVFLSENCQMLRDIALGCANLIDNLLYTD